MDRAARRPKGRRRYRVARRDDHIARPDGEDIAAERRELRIRHNDLADAALLHEPHEWDREQWRIHDREILRDRANER